MFTHNDFENANCDPWKYFKTPDDVFTNKELSKSDKITILESWKDICQKIKIAEDDGMRPFGEDLLPQINEKILKLRGSDKSY